MPKVSIIVAVYNVAPYLERAMDCLKNQTLQDLEFICIDDCSTDNSLDILRKYEEIDSRFKIITSKKNSGAATARNKGLKIANGEYLGFIDPDDAIDLNYYEELYNQAKEQDADIAKCERVKYDLDGTKHISTLNKRIKENGKLSFTYEWTTAIYKRALIEDNNIKFHDELIKAQDVVFLQSCILRTNKIILIENVHYYYYRRKGSLNASNIPLKSIQSALLANACRLKELNNYKDFNITKKDYLNLYCGLLYTIETIYYQNSTFHAKKICIDYLIKLFNECLYQEELKNIFRVKWMLPYIEKKQGLLIILLISLRKISNTIYSVCEKDVRKVITIFGLKIKIKSKKLIQKKQIKDFNEKIYKLQEEIIKQDIKIDNLINANSELKNKINANNKRIKQYTKNLTQKLHKYCPDNKRQLALKDWFFDKTGETLNLDNPQTFNEKIQWLKLYDSTPIKTKLADKYLVRHWVKEKIGEEYLIPLLGVWDSADKIDFDKLPDKFVLKCNHGCGYNIIVQDKSKLNIEDARKKLNAWMNEDYAFKCGFEMHYSPIPRKIIAEEYIENSENDLYDYKFWCFDGKVEYIQFLSERNTKGLKMAFYDREWNKQDFVYSYPLDIKTMPKPDNLELMINLSEKLAKDFNYVRIDLYRLDNGTIYFGEITFTSFSGVSKWAPQEMNYKIGQMININREGKIPAKLILK